MPPLDEGRAQKLIALARGRFPDLSPPEEEVLHASAISGDPKEPVQDAPRPSIRAEFVSWLVTDPEAIPCLGPRGLRALGVTILGDLDLWGRQVPVPMAFKQCTIEGKVYLRSAETRDCVLYDCSFKDAMSADGIVVNGSLLLRRSVFSSLVVVEGAQIKGDLDLSGAKISGGSGTLYADHIEIGGNVFLTDFFEASGGVRLLGAQIRGNLDCRGARLPGLGSLTLLADRAQIHGDVLLSQDFDSSGEVRLRGAEIAGDLSFLGATLNYVICTGLRVSGDLLWTGIRKQASTYLDLTGATIKTLRDDRASWPDAGKLEVDGLVYDELILHRPSTREDDSRNWLTEELPFVAEDRVAWLKLQPLGLRTKPQPWAQLSKYLESKGEHKAATNIPFELRRLEAERKWFLPRWQAIAVAWFAQDLMRILIPISFFVAIGTLIFAGADRSGAMIASARDHASTKPQDDHYPPFQPFIYALENNVPPLKLGMDEKWMPDPEHVPRPWFPRHHWLDGLRFFNSYAFLAGSRWGLIIMGWLEVTVLAQAFSSRLKQ